MASKRRVSIDRQLANMLALRDHMLRQLGREEAMVEKEKLVNRILDDLADSSEGMILEAMHRQFRMGLGLPPDPLDPVDDGNE